MAFHDPVRVVLYDKDDGIITPVMAPISVTTNLDAFSFDYVAIMLELEDPIRDEVLSRWTAGELVQFSVEGRFGYITGDVNSVYAYSAGVGSGEFTFYGRSHKEILKSVLGYPQPTNKDVSTQTATHAKYSGSELAILRQVLQANFVSRMGQKMRFPTGDLGKTFSVDFRFDEIHRHLYEDGKDKGGLELKENGEVVFDIYRDFAKREYVLTARRATKHSQLIEVASGLIDRWQFTSERDELTTAVLGGPGEMLKRTFRQVSRSPMRHRRFPREAFLENTYPDTGKESPTEAEVAAALVSWGESKLGEGEATADMNADIVESESFYLGGELRMGDYVRIGITRDIELGEQRVEKAIIVWSREEGYKVTLTKPDNTARTTHGAITRIFKAMHDLSARTRRK